MSETDKQIQQIAARLAGLREAFDATPEEMAKVCHLEKETYLKMERGETDIPVSVLHEISQAYGVELTTLMFGDEARMSNYFVTRNGKGVAVERTKAYKYMSLAAGFAGRKGDPFLVTVQPKSEDVPLPLNAHDGQEFNYVLSGRMQLQVGQKVFILEAGDSIHFDSRLPHAVKALDETEVVFLAIIL